VLLTGVKFVIPFRVVANRVVVNRVVVNRVVVNRVVAKNYYKKMGASCAPYKCVKLSFYKS